jgi:hypothetical protein
VLHFGHGFHLDTAGCNCISDILHIGNDARWFPSCRTMKLLNLLSVLIRDLVSVPGCTTHLCRIFYNTFWIF